MAKNSGFIKWWEDNKEDIHNKTLSTAWGSVFHFTQLAFQAGKVSSYIKGWCRECDAEILTEDAKFCQNCGKKF